MKNNSIPSLDFSKFLKPFIGLTAFLTFLPTLALAQTVSDVVTNIVNTNSDLPGLITGLSYLGGTLFGIYGILKTKDHVENPNQTPLRYPAMSLAAGGALFALPIIYEAMETMINAGTDTQLQTDTQLSTLVSGAAGAIAGALPVQVFGTILANIVESVEDVPGFVTAIAYLLGSLAGVAGVLKIKEHVEEPSKTPLKDGAVRFVVGGMLFAIPTIYQSLYNMIGEGGGLLNGFAQAQMAITSTGTTTEGGSCMGWVMGTTLGSVVCNLFLSTTPFLAFLSAMAYLFATFVGAWGILRIKDHVENPTNVSVWDPVAKLLVSGGFFALPSLVSVAFTSVAALIVPHTNTLNGATRGGGGGPLGLDAMLAALMNDTFVPVTALVNWFSLVAGFILVFIGVGRLMKSAQEGPRGPGGIGTLMTFAAGGALAAFSPIVTSLSSSLFVVDGLNTSNTGEIQYTAGLDVARAHTVLDAILLFVMLVGFISIVRGVFIMRGVAEGNSNASAMAGVTHLVGGALAVNLGPLLNAVQVTLGIRDLGLGIIFG